MKLTYKTKSFYLDTRDCDCLEVRIGSRLWQLDLDKVEENSVHYPVADDLIPLDDIAKLLGYKPAVSA